MLWRIPLGTQKMVVAAVAAVGMGRLNMFYRNMY
jgi:hypothetical protein